MSVEIPSTTIMKCGSRDEWLSARKQYATASEVSRIIGATEGGLQLYCEKRNEIPAEDISDLPRVKFGTRMEGPLCEWYEEDFGIKVVRPPQWSFEVSTQWPWLSCTPDAYEEDGLHIQFKTADTYQRKEWGASPPLHYQIQVQSELAVLGRDIAWLAVLFGHDELERFDIKRDDRFIKAMAAATKEFMNGVRDGVPPEIDGSLSTARALKLLHPDDNGEEVELPAEAAAWDSRLLEVKDGVKAFETEKRQLESRLRAAIGDNTFGLLPDGATYSLKTQQRAEHVVKASQFRVLRRKG